MSNKTLLIGLATAVAGFGIAGSVLAYQGNVTKYGPNHTAEREAAMTQVMEKGDYQGWKNLMVGRGRADEIVNEQNFPKFVEAWKLSKAGKTAEAEAIRKDLGLGQGKGQGRGQGGCGAKAAGKNAQGGCARHAQGGQNAKGFVDLNNDGVCDNHAK